MQISAIGQMKSGAMISIGLDDLAKHQAPRLAQPETEQEKVFAQKQHRICA